eukprot:TRINITY_DN537_c0_g1_i1.p1 TRINITY_DN537_c0_g1~~TRINITY_DN537_c0_g1_i1.p1  ORF type:complete len:515 (-),score=108.92 TRINITY_DN537_c0_g1_i1:373-1917(-)
MEKKRRKTDISFLVGKGSGVEDQTIPPTASSGSDTQQRIPVITGRPQWLPSMSGGVSMTSGAMPDVPRKSISSTPMGWSSFEFTPPPTPSPSTGNGSLSGGVIDSHSGTAFSTRSTPFSSFPMSSAAAKVYQPRPVNLQNAQFTSPTALQTVNSDSAKAALGHMFPPYDVMPSSMPELMVPMAARMMTGAPSYVSPASSPMRKGTIDPLFRQYARGDGSVPQPFNPATQSHDVSRPIPFRKLDAMQGKLMSIAHRTGISPNGSRLPFERPPKGGHLLGWKRDREDGPHGRKPLKKTRKFAKKSYGRASSSRKETSLRRSDGEKQGQLRDGDTIDPALCQTQSVLIKLFGLPDNFRYRDARKWLFNKCDDRQRDFLDTSPLCDGVNQILLKTLPHRLTVKYFATCILVLAFHLTALTGKVPTFWGHVRDNKEIIDCIDKDVMHLFKPEIGVCVRSRRAQLLVKGEGTEEGEAENEEALSFEVTVLRCASDYHERLKSVEPEKKSDAPPFEAKDVG